MKRDLYCDRIVLSILSPENVSKAYQEGMNKETLKYTGHSLSRSFKKSDLEKYVRDKFESAKDFLYGIYDVRNDMHIGNIKLGDIDFIKKVGDIGIVVWAKDYLGRGYGSEAIKRIVMFAFSDLKLMRVYANMDVRNTGSMRAFLKAGFNEYKRTEELKGSNTINVVWVERFK